MNSKFWRSVAVGQKIAFAVDRASVRSYARGRFFWAAVSSASRRLAVVCRPSCARTQARCHYGPIYRLANQVSAVDLSKYLSTPDP